MSTPSVEAVARHAGLRVAASVGGALVLFLVVLAIVRPEMMGMASVVRTFGIGWWPS